ncbi:putative sterigmatocystin biosynthesis lipase/esterase stcI [Madurella mycetomatis]|uniref:Putative sterigmatocystin biosynthesis lipase/esterase stcI n=1 Tax=Madurella mycetomatis TaxID=100816 RepID=A0A175VXV9_9PEZI|nr:putative sterigmatocystin biosynthesis lipase/esterase stcI [Madurella mycetomatis]KXX82084.1 putative sterigmatocystin biosynthesis lipase/esterase stcI [Madurella mycetomatis]
MIPTQVLCPSSGEARRSRGESGALVYFHDGGYSVGSVDEFENGLKLVAEVYAVYYRLAPEFRYPMQLDEYSAVINWLQDNSHRTRDVH